MNFKTLITFTGYEVLFILTSMALVVVYQILTGKINLADLLEDKEKGSISLERVQLIVFTLFGALYFILHVINDPSQFPDVPRDLVTLMGGSSLLYLGGKAYSFRNRPSKKNQPNQGE